MEQTIPTPAPERASTSDVTFTFVSREAGPERLVCEADLVFLSTGILAGLKLVGFSRWGSPEGEIYVTFPSRAFGSGNERRFFDYLHPANGGAAAAQELKEAPRVSRPRAVGRASGPSLCGRHSYAHGDGGVSVVAS
jgi:hypothetical protein